jgi:hypothetical protein
LKTKKAPVEKNVELFFPVEFGQKMAFSHIRSDYEYAETVLLWRGGDFWEYVASMPTLYLHLKNPKSNRFLVGPRTSHFCQKYKFHLETQPLLHYFSTFFHLQAGKTTIEGISLEF